MNRKENRQRLFDISVAHILAQGPAVVRDENGRVTCQYLTADGRRCAAAPFITDYAPNMESRSFYYIAKTWPDSVMPEAAEESSLVCELQQAHDWSATFGPDGNFLPRYVDRIRWIAEAAGVSPAVLGPY